MKKDTGTRCAHYMTKKVEVGMRPVKRMNEIKYAEIAWCTHFESPVTEADADESLRRLVLAKLNCKGDYPAGCKIPSERKKYGLD